MVGGGGVCDIYENTGYTSNIGWHHVVLANNGSQKTIIKSATDNTLGDFVINSNTLSSNADYAPAGFGANNATLKANKLAITLRPQTGKLVRVFGATSFNGGEIITNDLDIDLIFAREITSVLAPIESYGVQVGVAVKGEDRAADKTSKITVNNADIKVTNSANTQDKYFFSLVWVHIAYLLFG